MKQIDYSKLEKSNAFKKSYYSKTIWWFHLSMIAPLLLIFIGTVGLVYLVKQQLLASFYTIPYFLLFILGTVLLRVVKQHLFKTTVDKENSYLICVAKNIEEKDGYVYTLFVTDKRRHDANVVSHLSKKIDCAKLVSDHQLAAQKTAILIDDEKTGENFYLRAYAIYNINKRCADWKEKGSFAVLYIDERNVPIVKKIDLM